MENRIDTVNQILLYRGSDFRCLEDGKTLGMCVNGNWLLKVFNNIDELEHYLGIGRISYNE